ncbi:hypothetical protein [Microvirga sp. KLBC 81]|uniref:hypothetical protein n=1 Tax=Microvirga sp. KLBC 81 TaxID=1862707 RepID=UPI001057A5C8|nr:hypothetical protein [Microvirga sp. KLBC 81]
MDSASSGIAIPWSECRPCGAGRKALGPRHVPGSARRRETNVDEEERYLVEDTEIRFVSCDRVEFADEFEQRCDAFCLVPRIHDQSAELSPGLKCLEAFQGIIKLAAAPAI